MNELTIVLIALACGWLGSMAKSYFLEKGKNLATKEDIQEITAKVEFVKSQFNRKHLRSKAYIERQIRAYDEIFHLLNEITKINYKAIGEIDFIEEYENKYSKATYVSSKKLLAKMDEHLIFISTEVCGVLTEVAAALYEFSKIEYAASLSTDVEERRGKVIIAWTNVSNLLEDALFQIRKEFADD